jgi:phosphoenolpyruvate carboxykinase (ATP)
MNASALSADQLTDLAIKRQEGRLTNQGVLVVETGKRTGRSPKDRFIVRDGETETNVFWNTTNQPMLPADFDYWYGQAKSHMQQHDCLSDTFQVGNQALGLCVQVHTEYAWHLLFAHNLFSQVIGEPSWQLINLPSLKPTKGVHGAVSDGLVMINFTQKCVLILGMRYAGEMKKAMFTALNYLLPARDVLPMHCSANMGDDGQTALFFGLSGTGKTTLSMDASRQLIGDDEHGWSADAVFNFEGGCYAKCIHLDQKAEPVIYQALRPGAIMENVVIDEAGQPDFDDDRLTENTRAAYPRSFIDNCVPANSGPVPKHVIFLTCDMYGVLPPIAKLSAEQILFYFLSGYTAKVGSTEVGGGKGIQPTFSTCFGAPFFPRDPMVYAQLLLKRVEAAGASVYLVNTGWHQGAYGQGGNRYAIAVTRQVVDQITSGQLDGCQWHQLPGFGFLMPSDAKLPCSPDPRADWVDQADYVQTANRLIEQLNQNFEQYDPSGQQAGRPQMLTKK